MKNFTSFLATTALVSLNADAVSQLSQKSTFDPIALSQTAVGSTTALTARDLMHARQAEQLSQLAQVSQAETPAPTEPATPATPAATTPVAPATAEAPEAKSDCSKSILATFFPDETAPASPISQFQKFVQETCPSLKLQVPNGVVVTSCFHTGYFLLRTLRPLADAIPQAKSTDEAGQIAD